MHGCGGSKTAQIHYRVEAGRRQKRHARPRISLSYREDCNERKRKGEKKGKTAHLNPCRPKFAYTAPLPFSGPWTRMLRLLREEQGLTLRVGPSLVPVLMLVIVARWLEPDAVAQGRLTSRIVYARGGFTKKYTVYQVEFRLRVEQVYPTSQPEIYSPGQDTISNNADASLDPWEHLA